MGVEFKLSRNKRERELSAHHLDETVRGAEFHMSRGRRRKKRVFSVVTYQK